MPYCTLTDLQVLLDTPTLVDLSDGTGTTPNATVIAGVIAIADGIIDAALGPVYVVPLTTVPAIITAISSELAIYTLYGRHHDRSASDAVKARYDNVMKQLQDIADGKVSLGSSVTLAAAVGPTIRIIEPYSNNKFNLNTLEPLNSPDPDYIEVADAL